MDAVLVDVAATLFFVTFVRAFDADWSLDQRLAYAESFFRARGYGNPRVADVLEGNTVTATSSHYSEGYKSKFGVQDEPQDFFLTGALQGALSAAFGCDVTVEQEECLAMEDDRNAWTVTRHPNRQDDIEEYMQRAKRLQQHRSALTPAPKPDDLPAPPITSAVRNMDLVGDPDEGLIPAFNVYLTFIPSLYYNACSQVFLDRIQENDMSRSLGVRLLKEAGQVCGFYTLGNILISSEFELLRQSHFGSSPGEEASITALFGAVNALGWGYWQLDELGPDALRFTVHNSYEAYNYREYFGEADEPVCMLHSGGGAAIMNALRHGDVLDYGGSINRNYVNSVFEESDGFQANEEQCHAVAGDGHACHVHITR
jgi:predicted hydrocarbon binding protein